MRNFNIHSIPSLHDVMISLTHLDLRSLTINLLGVSMLALAFITGFPQARHALINETVAGVSMSGLINGSLSSLAWLAWALGNSLFWIVASCMAGIPALLATWWAVRRSGTVIARREMILPALWATALIGAALLGHWTHVDTMSIVLGTSLMWYLLPAVVEVWRASDVSGVSAASWWLTLTCAAVGATYGVVAAVPAEIIYGGLSAAGTIVVLVRLAQKSRVWCDLCGRLNECWCLLDDEVLEQESTMWAA